MKESSDGLPKTGPSARMLGVRPAGNTLKKPDVLAVNPSDIVYPGQGGMSVAPNDPSNLPSQRRPMSLGGFGSDPVWKIDSDDIGPDLKFRQDSPIHGVIEPIRVMTLQEYQDTLANTKDKWQLHCR
jgi:hypothetical protein